MKPRVLASLEDDTGDRCIDLLQAGDGFGWVECRRDPEDAHGWRHLHPPRMGFAAAAEARADAAAAVGWFGEGLAGEGPVALAAKGGFEPKFTGCCKRHECLLFGSKS